MYFIVGSICLVCHVLWKCLGLLIYGKLSKLSIYFIRDYLAKSAEDHSNI